MTFFLDHDTPDGLAYCLESLGQGVEFLRKVLPRNAEDSKVLAYAHAQSWIVISCNRDHFLALAKSQPHSGIIILIRRMTRVAERAALIRLLGSAGENGIRNNINFA